MCEQLKKNSLRSFSEAWLSDDKFASWIRKVSGDNNHYHCTMCNKIYSCNTNVHRHANSEYHKNSVKKYNDVSSNPIKPKKYHFRQQWLDIKELKPWLREVPHDTNSFFCLFCNKAMIGSLSHIYEHAQSQAHIKLSEKYKETNKNNTSMNESVDDEAVLTFEERKKSAEIRYAAFIIDKNISYKTASELLNLFQYIGKDSNILKNMTMNHTQTKRKQVTPHL